MWELQLINNRSAKSCKTGCGSSAGSWDKTLRVWDVEAEVEVSKLEGHANGVFACSFSPDGSRVVTGSADRTLVVWHTDSGEKLFTLRGHTDWVRSCAFSPDGSRVVSGSVDSTLRLWDTSDGAELLCIRGHKWGVTCCAFSRDGTRIFSSSDDGTLKIWEATTGFELATLVTSEPRGQLRWFALSRSGSRLLCAANQSTLKVWNIETGESVALVDDNDYIYTCDISPDGLLAVTGSWTRLKLWDAETGQLLATYAAHDGGVEACAFFPDGNRILSASRDHTLKVWDAVSRPSPADEKAPTGRLLKCTFTSSGPRMVTAFPDGTLRLWDAGSGSGIRTYAGAGGEALGCDFSPDSTRLASLSGDGMLTVWDISSGLSLRSFGDRRPNDDSCAFCRYSSCSCGEGGDRIRCVFSADERRIVAPSAKGSIVRDSETGEILATLHSGGECAFSSNGQHIVAFDDNGLFALGDTKTYELTYYGNSRLGRIRSNVISPSGDQLVFKDHKGMLCLLDLEARDITRLTEHVGEATSSNWSGDASLIVVGATDGSLKIWDVGTRKEIVRLYGRGGEVTACAFSPDGTLVAAATRRGVVDLWDVASMKRLARFCPGVALDCIEWSPNGKQIIVGGSKADEVYLLQIGNADEFCRTWRIATVIGALKTWVRRRLQSQDRAD